MKMVFLNYYLIIAFHFNFLVSSHAWFKHEMHKSVFAIFLGLEC